MRPDNYDRGQVIDNYAGNLAGVTLRALDRIGDLCAISPIHDAEEEAMLQGMLRAYADIVMLVTGVPVLKDEAAYTKARDIAETIKF